MRLHHFLARAGISSRRRAENLITDGLVRVNGIVITQLGMEVDLEKDLVEVRSNHHLDDWVKVNLPSDTIVYALNKPAGYASTVSDPYAKKAVVDLVPKEPPVYPVGRLDEDSEGLILLTNDGDLTYRLSHPSKHVDKTYMALCKLPKDYDHKVLPANITKLESGVVIDGKRTAPAKVRVVNNNGSMLELHIKISEGRNRQIRKMAQKIGLNVVQLVRTQIGGLKLSDLKIKPGEYKKLSEGEIKLLERN